MLLKLSLVEPFRNSVGLQNAHLSNVKVLSLSTDACSVMAKKKRATTVFVERCSTSKWMTKNESIILFRSFDVMPFSKVKL